MHHIFSRFFFVGFGAILPGVAFAQAPAVIPETVTTIAGLYGIVCSGINWFFSFIMIIAVFAILYAGLRFMTAGGQPEGVASARRYFAYALVGIVVAFLARGLVLTTSDFLGADIGSALSCF